MDNKIYVTRSSMPPIEEYVEKIASIWDSHWMTNSGAIYQELEKNLKDYLGCENLELYVNGHMALDISIKALQLKGEIITTPFTFASTTHAIVMNGLTPVFCDIKADDYTIDEEKVEALITEKTSAILAVHVYGQPCNVKRLAEIAQKHNIRLIYDAAHAFGVKVDGKSIACFGDVTMFSFHATKVFNTIEGGAIIFSDTSLERRLKSLRNFGIEGPESVMDVGYNAKMNEFSAAMGICNLKHLSEEIKKREHIFHIYTELLAGHDGITITDPKRNQRDGIISNYAYFPMIVDDRITHYTRDDLFEELQNHNIFARKYFYPLITDFECYQDRFSSYELPVAQHVAKSVLTLPIYAELADDDIKRICKVILEYKK